MLGNILLAIALICFIGACAVPESKSQPAGGILYRVSAFLSSARAYIALPMAGVILCVFVEQAIAQVPGTVVMPAVTWQQAAAALAVQALQIAGPAVLAWFSWQLNRWFGLQQEAQRREAFQTALTNAAGKMVQAVGGTAQVIAIGAVERNKALHEGLAYLEQAAPDAIAFFKLSRDNLIEKLEAKVGLLIAESMGTTGK